MTLDELFNLPSILSGNGLIFIPRLPGVYAVINRHTKRAYVGSAINMRSRCSAHLSGLKRNDVTNGAIRRDLQKFGLEHFACVALDVFSSMEEAGGDYGLGAREFQRIRELGTHIEINGYNSQVGCEWSKPASFRDRERKLIRGRSYTLLDGVDLYDPISEILLNGWLRDLENPDHWRR